MTCETASKTCATCGRIMTARRRWRDNFDAVRYCSKGCRQRRPNRQDQELESAILALLGCCPQDGSICPSAAACQVFGDVDGLKPEPMERARAAARRLVALGRLEIAQGSRRVDPSTARGPIRLRRPR